MSEEFIVVIDDNESLCDIIYEQLRTRFAGRYSIARFYDPGEAESFIEEYIDQAGNALALVATDERLKGPRTGHELLAQLSRSHPVAKKLIFSAYSDTQALIAGINAHIDAFVSKGRDGGPGDELFSLIDRLIEEREAQPNLSYAVSGVTFKQVDTLNEKRAFLRRRYEIYLQVGHKTLDAMREEERKLGMEWDEYDFGGVDSLVLTPRVRYLIAKKGSECLGGVRIIDGRCPMETGVCLQDAFSFATGDKFDLESFRQRGVYTREVSRLIVDPEWRARSSVVLIGLFRLIEQLTSEQNTLLCTAKEAQVRLYRAIGFEVVGPPIRYSLAGNWKPMMRNRWKAFNRPDLIPEMNIAFHRKCTEPVPVSEVECWNEYSRTVNEEAIRTGFYINGKR